MRDYSGDTQSKFEHRQLFLDGVKRDYEREDKMRSHLCDVCGKEVGDDGLWKLTTGYKTDEINDLCSNCWEAFRDYLAITKEEYDKLLEKNVQHFLTINRKKLFKEENSK